MKKSLAALLCGFLLLPAGAAAPSFAFNVDIALSPKAAATLKAQHRGVRVIAYYEGEPVKGKESMALEGNVIDLGTEDVTIPGAGRAAVTGARFVRAHLGWVKSVRLLINVVSAGKPSDLNQLGCGIFEDTLAKAQAQPIAIACKLLTES